MLKPGMVFGCAVNKMGQLQIFAAGELRLEDQLACYEILFEAGEAVRAYNSQVTKWHGVELPHKEIDQIVSQILKR